MENVEQQITYLKCPWAHIEIIHDSHFEIIEKWLPVTRPQQSFNSPSPSQLDGRIEICYGYKRQVIADFESHLLRIEAPDLDRLQEAAVLNLLLNIWRFVALCVSQNGIYLLHACAGMLPNGKGVLFCDNDGCLADSIRSVKTSPLLELVLSGGVYVADEIVFWNENSGKVFGCPKFPIRIRPLVKKSLAEFHGLQLHSERGLFWPDELNLQEANASFADMCVYVHGDQNRSSIVHLSQQQAELWFEVTCTAHLAKLLYPQLDRARFDLGKDIGQNTVVANNMMAWKDEILSRFPHIRSIVKQGAKLPAYQINVEKYNDIGPMMRELA